MSKKLNDVQKDWNTRINAKHKNHLEKKMLARGIKYGKKEKKIKN